MESLSEDQCREQIESFARKSVVSLMAMRPDTFEKRILGSGTIVEVSGHAFVVTAAHVLLELENIFKEDERWRLNIQGMFNQPIYEHIAMNRIYIDGKFEQNSSEIEFSHERDIGFYRLGQLTVKNLLAESCRIIPLREFLIYTEKERESPGIGMWIIGFPSNAVDPTASERFDFHLALYPARNLRIEGKTAFLDIDSNPDVKGVSGGPVVGIFGNQPKLAAIQVSQLGNPRKYRVLACQRIYEYLVCLEDTMKESVSKQDT